MITPVFLFLYYKLRNLGAMVKIDSLFNTTNTNFMYNFKTDINKRGSRKSTRVGSKK